MKIIYLTFGFLICSCYFALSQCPPSTTCTATWTTVEYDLGEIMDQNVVNKVISQDQGLSLQAEL
jgi:hypothetical protein